MLTCDKYSFRDTAAELVSASPAQPVPLWRYLTPASWKMLLNVHSPQTATEMVRQHLRSVDLGANNRPPYNVLNLQNYICVENCYYEFETSGICSGSLLIRHLSKYPEIVRRTILLKVCADKCPNVCWRQLVSGCRAAPMSTELSDAGWPSNILHSSPTTKGIHTRAV